MTDAFWLAINSVGIALTALFVWLGKRQNITNAKTVSAIYEKVNGQTEQRVREARTTAPQILIVEDNIADIEIMSYHLRKFGCDILEARTGDRARELVKSRIGSERGLPFDLVLVDLRLSCGEDANDVVTSLESIAPLLRIAIITGQPDGLLIQKVCRGRCLFVLDKESFDVNLIEKIFNSNHIPFTKSL